MAALQYAAGAQVYDDLLARAVDVAAQTLQPTLELRSAERWLRVDPTALAAHRAIAEAALELQKIDLSAAQYRVVVSAAAQGREALLEQIDGLLRASDNVYGARQLADQLAKDFPDSPTVYRLQGYAALRADDPAAAVRGFDTAIARSPADDDARRDLRMAWLRARVLSGDADSALAESSDETVRDDTPTNRFDYCLLLWAARRDAPLREQLDRLIAVPEARADALRVYGLFEFEQGNDEAARARFTELLTTGRYAGDAFYYLGVIAERHADVDRALRWYARVQQGDNTVPAVLRASSILYTHGAGATADELLERLVEDEPARAPEILSARAQIYVLADQPTRALALLTESLHRYPDSVQLRYALASTLDEAGQVDAALRELAQLSAERPDDPAAMNALGYTLADHARELGRARALIERAYAAAPRSAAIRDSLGWVLYRQGKAAAALPYLSAAYADDPGGDIGAHLGEVLWKLGSRADAERIWAEAAKIDADDKLLKATRSRLHASEPGGA